MLEERYEILGELGAGSFGRVYHARQRSTGQSVALKVANAGGEPERFRRELQICAELSHPHIVPLIDSGETEDGGLYAVFGHVEGETLEEALQREGRLPVKESLRLMTQVLDALACAHARGIVHRDLKPANIMLGRGGARRNAMILDFGLGGLAEGWRRQRWRTLTQSREFVGTPFYAAPEQIAGALPTPKSDLYAWGLVLLECLTGSHPFEQPGNAGLLSGHGPIEIPAWLRGHPLEHVLEGATAPAVAERVASATALLERLDEIGELPAAPGLPAPLRERGERRHLTVMFCDLVDSSELSQRLDPEAYRRVLHAYRACCEEAVARYDGHVAQYLGDGVLVYFGFPQAHEDAAERAVRTAREIVRRVAELRPDADLSLAARIGIHTGLVVVDESGAGDRGERLALGATPNIAARLQGLAEPGTVLISDATLRLVAGIFEVRDLGTPELKGIRDAPRVFAVLRTSGVGSRLDRAQALTPFVGRDQELGLVVDRFEQVCEGQGQVVQVSGEAGIGKSRLIRELRERLHETPHTWLECRTSPYTQQSAFAPVIGLLEQALAFPEHDAPGERIERLERGLVQAGLDPADSVPLLASLLSLRLPDRYAPLGIGAQLQRQRTLETLLAWLLALGEQQPLVLAVEDLHWADPSTLEWLGLVIEQCPTARILLLLTFRPEFEPPWPARGHVLPIALGRLARRHVADLVAGAIPEKELPEGLLDRIASRSDGVPLFAEELAKGVVETGREGAGSIAGVEIPETLQDSLMARLDRLGEAKAVAQLGSALGREFPYALLEAIAPMKEVALREGLERLVEAELLYRRGIPPRTTYTFKHALVQDVAYESLLESQRRELHGRIADSLEARFPERVSREPEIVALHCEAAGRTGGAIRYRRAAAERAAGRSAHAEAIAHLERAIEMLRELPESPERDQQELGLQIGLGASVQAARGFASPEVAATYARALSLSRRSGLSHDAPEHFRSLSGLAMYYRNCDITHSIELGRELLDHAERTGEVSQLLFAHSNLGVCLYFHSDFASARAHEEQAIALYDPVAHRSLESVYGLDPGIGALCLNSLTRWQQGEPDGALEPLHEALQQARAHQRLHSLAYALCWAAVIHLARGDPRRALERADEALHLARERGFPQHLAGGALLRANALLRLGKAETGLPASFIEDTKDLLNPAGGTMVLDHVEGLRRTDRPDDAMRWLRVWRDRAAELHASYCDAEGLRLEGEIRLAQDPAAHAEAESCFERALSISQSQEARSIELRAATSLARLLRDRGERTAARALLQPVYDGFTEGFGTADLKDARALLGEL